MTRARSAAPASGAAVPAPRAVVPAPGAASVRPLSPFRLSVCGGFPAALVPSVFSFLFARFLSVFAVVFFSFLLSCCSPSPSPEQAAAEAAKGYYEALVTGRPSVFLDGRADADSLPPAYREQLLVACRQFLHQQQQAHQGLLSVSVVSAVPGSAAAGSSAAPGSAASAGSSAASAAPASVPSSPPLDDVSVQLLITFADSLSEEVVVPMVFRGGRWLMR